MLAPAHITMLRAMVFEASDVMRMSAGMYPKVIHGKCEHGADVRLLLNKVACGFKEKCSTRSHITIVKDSTTVTLAMTLAHDILDCRAQVFDAGKTVAVLPPRPLTDDVEQVGACTSAKVRWELRRKFQWVKSMYILDNATAC